MIKRNQTLGLISHCILNEIWNNLKTRTKITCQYKGGPNQMLKDLAWNVFEHTGSMDAYIFYREINERDRADGERTVAEEEAATSKNPA